MNIVLFNTHDVILLITIYQAILLSFALLFFRPAGKLGSIFLILCLLSNACIPLDTLISFGEAFHAYAAPRIPNWFYLLEMGYWLQGPCLFLFFRALNSPGGLYRWSDLWYLLPSFLFLAHQMLAYWSFADTGKIYLDHRHEIASESVSVFYIIFLRASLNVYFVILAWQVMKLFWSKKPQQSGRAFLWIKILVFGFLVLWVWHLFIAIALILNNHFLIPINIRMMGLTANYFTCLFLGLLIMGLILGFTHIQSREALVVVDDVPINPEEIEQLEKIIELKKLYTDSGLTVELLAKELGWSARHLSSLINRHYHCHFYDFINRYRINETKRLIVDPQHRQSSILEIMYHVGFNSKTTFNSCFKKQVGLTPREFRKQFVGVNDSADS